MIKSIQFKMILVFFLVGIILIGGLRMFLFIFIKYIK